MKIQINKILLLFWLMAGLLLLSSCDLLKEKGTDPPIVPGDIIFSMRDNTESQNYQIYTVNIDGTGFQQITDLKNNESTQPSWSPDSSQIVFTTTLESTSLGTSIFIMNEDGSNIRPMKKFFGSSYDFVQPGFGPRWSPDGNKIAFSWCMDCELSGSNIEVFIYDFIQDSVFQITDNPAIDISPRWNHDGTRIAFSSDRNYPNERSRSDVFETDVYGENLRQITTDGELGSFVYNSNNQTYIIKKNTPPFKWYTLNSSTLDTVENQILSLSLEPSKFSFLKWSVSGNYLLLYHSADGIISYYIYDLEHGELKNLDLPQELLGIDVR